MFSEQFAFQPHSLINFVGGGGKTALIHKLMEEYCSQGPILYTTTMRIHPPNPIEGLSIISSDDLSVLKSLLDCIGRLCPSNHYKIAATRRLMTPKLLRGVPTDFTNELNREFFQLFLNEADGAASYSIKAPREGEPLLMDNAEYLVPVIGIDCLNKPAREVLFRWHNAAERFSVKADDLITPERAADILMHRLGVCKDWQAGMSIIPFINKTDKPDQDSIAGYLAKLIMRNNRFPVKRVVIGSVLRDRAEVLSAESI